MNTLHFPSFLRKILYTTFLVIIVFSLILMAESSPSAGAQEAWTPTPARPTNVPEIVGGAQADPGERPWVVALIGGSDPDLLGQFCGGSLITSQWVLTAAHCLYDFSVNPPSPINPSDVDVVAGVYNLVTPVGGFQRRNVFQIIRHASFDPTSDNSEFDIALLQLTSPVTIGFSGATRTSLIPLVPSSVGTLAGTNSWATGWGAIASGGPLADRLLEVEVPIITNTNCNTAYNPFGISITSSMLCAGAIGKDACQGDSGGPLVVPSNNIWRLAGIVSWGIDCGVHPGVYTRVSDYVSWINSSVPDRQNVFIGDLLQGKYNLTQNQSTRDGYIVDDGPAQVLSTDGSSVITALRVIWKEPGPRYSYSEMMGLPVEQLSSEYWFPWYNFAAPNSMDQGFRIANVDSAANTVEVRVGTTLLDTIALGGGASVRVGYPGVDNGPIKILCTTCSNTGTDKIIAALRVIWKEPGFRASYSEMMGLPKEQLSSEYWFPWYNNVAVNSMDQGFRIANVDSSPNTVEVRVGTSLLDTITLAGGASVRVGYNVDNGPIQVLCTTCSTGTDVIIAALRVIWKEPGLRTSYSEMMGLPVEALSTEYWFPWYNNTDTAAMDQGFRIANIDTVDHTVRVFVGAAQVGSDILLPGGGSTRVGYAVNNGPIRVICTTCNSGSANDRIIAALRVIWQEPGFRASYSEMMGLPAEQLSTEYWFPWYNNASISSMDQGFRIGVP